MSDNHTQVPDTIVFAGVLSFLLLICTSFSLVFATQDAENFRKCVQRERTSPDECALIIYGR